MSQTEEKPSPNSENLSLPELVVHRESVQADETVDQVFEKLKVAKVEYVAVLQEKNLVGIASRSQLGLLLSGKYGYSIHERDRVTDHLVTPHLELHEEWPLLHVFQTALSRQGERFFDDMPLVDARGSYLGMVPVELLVRLQSAMIGRQVISAEKNRRELQDANRQLYRSLNELRQSKGRYDILFENSALGVALLNCRGGVETANQRLDILLRSDDGAPAEKYDLGSFVVAAEQPAFKKLLMSLELHHDSRAAKNGEFNLLLPRVGQRLFKFHTNWIPETGQICVLLDDITEQRLLERRVAQKERSELLESVVGGIAHEINNKLSPVVGFASLLAEQVKSLNPTGEISQYCATIQESALESAKIIKQLLQLSRPHGVELQPADLSTIAEDAAKFLKFRLRENDCTVHLEFPRQAATVLADQGQIKQVVMNLILNAIDAVKGRAVREITLRVEQNPEQTFLYVSDTGHGIKLAHLPRIFDPFFSTKASDSGSGLGLSVCHSILQQHCGEIAVENAMEGKTTFKVTLATLVGQETSVAPAAENAARVCTEKEAEQLKRAHVLIVDDEPFMTSLLQEALRLKVNCSVDQASDGNHAITYLKESPYNLVISDVRMSGMDGFGLYSWMQTNLPALTSRFVFITGDAGSADLDQKLTGLGVPVLRKPFNLDELIDLSQKLIFTEKPPGAKILAA